MQGGEGINVENSRAQLIRPEHFAQVHRSRQVFLVCMHGKLLQAAHEPYYTRSTILGIDEITQLVMVLLMSRVFNLLLLLLCLLLF